MERQKLTGGKWPSGGACPLCPNWKLLMFKEIIIAVLRQLIFLEVLDTEWPVIKVTWCDQRLTAREFMAEHSARQGSLDAAFLQIRCVPFSVRLGGGLRPSCGDRFHGAAGVFSPARRLRGADAVRRASV
ncbi:hypothetical protein [Streptomyces formicae]|uniref:Uncharacterized protein n=1 Tax=Streptomyces formicae TaxID=1616117 RepID=A0ABY3WHE3_9ACTN|nr:hypothetical protein [Streptomyces formicae]UNM12004.1 hypothetical protein J4032_11030 [Streptomyces formicae]